MGYEIRPSKLNSDTMAVGRFSDVVGRDLSVTKPLGREAVWRNGQNRSLLVRSPPPTPQQKMRFTVDRGRFSRKYSFLMLLRWISY